VASSRAIVLLPVPGYPRITINVLPVRNFAFSLFLQWRRSS